MNAIEFNEYGKMNSIVDAIEFPDWLQKEMDQRGWSFSDLARAAGVSRGTIGNVVRGERAAGRRLATAIAKAFDYPPETVFRAAGLLPEEGDKPENWDMLEWLFQTAHPDDQEAAIAMLQVLRDQRAQREREQQEQAAAKRRRGRPAEG
jgi:transcriptional regulator with XRE-family HTH domain